MKPTLLAALISVVFTTPQVFGGASELDALEARLAEQERLIQQLQQENRTLRSPQKTSSKPASTPATTTSAKTYTVQPGDSLERIARRNQTTPEAVAQSNRLKLTSVIYVGQKLQLPAAKPALEQVASSTPATTSGNKHTIKEGETYFSISRKHGTTVNALVAANPQIKPTALRPGQVIQLAPPAAATTPVLNTKSKAPAAASSHAPKPAPTPPAAPAAKASGADAEVSLSDQHTASKQPERKIRSVSIEGEMTYGEFAAKHGTDTDRLNGLNGLDLTTATVLAKGSELYVPAQP